MYNILKTFTEPVTLGCKLIFSSLPALRLRYDVGVVKEDHMTKGNKIWREQRLDTRAPSIQQKNKTSKSALGWRWGKAKRVRDRRGRRRRDTGDGCCFSRV